MATMTRGEDLQALDAHDVAQGPAFQKLRELVLAAAARGELVTGVGLGAGTGLLALALSAQVRLPLARVSGRCRE